MQISNFFYFQVCLVVFYSVHTYSAEENVYYEAPRSNKNLQLLGDIMGYLYILAPLIPSLMMAGIDALRLAQGILVEHDPAIRNEASSQSPTVRFSSVMGALGMV